MKHETPKLLASEMLLKSSPFSIFSRRYRLGSQAEIERRVIEHPGAVVLLPQSRDSTVIMIRQYRYPIDRWLLEFPAGTLEAGEDPLTCAKRELSEEVACDAKDWVALGELFPTPGFCNEKQFLFLARELGSAPGTPDEDELIEIESLKVSHVEDLIKRGEILDAKSVSIFFKARLLGYL